MISKHLKRRELRLFVGLLSCFGIAACGPISQKSLDEPNGFTNLGNQLHSRGDDVGAVDMYQRELQQKPDDVDARQALVQILEAHGDLVEAERQCSEALKYAPESDALLFLQGRLFIKTGHADDARATYEKILSRDDQNIKALNGLGVSLDYLGQHSAAQQAYMTALAIEHDNLTTLNNLAHSYVLVGGHDQAIKLLEPHVKDKNATPVLRQNLAEAYGLAGMEADAERISRIDLSSEQTKRNLAYYRAERVRLGLTPKFYADLGDYATEVLAQSHVASITSTFAPENSGLIVTIHPSVQAIGGTPRFNVQVTGFEKIEKLNSFCERLRASDIGCKAQINATLSKP